MENYFSRFPLTVYSNTAIRDISRRVSIPDASYSTPHMFYPIELLAGLRPDILADSYYSDPEMDWVVYLSNQIVDPYYEWYMEEYDFNKYLLDKYGDYDLPRKKIKFYRNNWSQDETEISPSFYENNLAWDQKQYWSPRYGDNGKIMGYKRKQSDWITNTNKIYQYTVSYVSGNTFTVGEILDIRAGGTIGDVIDGGAEVVFSNSTALIVQHVSGNATANSSWLKYIVGEDSNNHATANLSVTLQENITNDTAAFWTPVTYYEWESERNESRKHIHLLNPSIVNQTANIIKKKLQE